jgi:hypothetical protein
MATKDTSGARARRWERYLGLAADAGEILMSLRDRPTRLDWVALAFRAASFGLRVRAEKRRLESRGPWSYFESSGSSPEWLSIPDEFEGMVLEHIAGVEVADETWDGEPDSDRVYLATIGGEQVGWIGDGQGEPLAGPYLRAARERETYRALGERIWRGLGTRHCLFAKGGLGPDPFAGAHLGATTQLRELHGRLVRFLELGLHRSCLFVGPPGTGKSTGIRYLAAALGLQSLRVDLSALGQSRAAQVSDTPVWLETLLKALAPEMLILDDLDRVGCGGELLHVLELAAATCRIVLASANGTDKMLGAVLRPGRMDEVIRVDRPDLELLRALLGEDADLAERLSSLPVAYVSEFVKRRQALGRERALAELDELCARRRLVEEQSAGEG